MAVLRESPWYQQILQEGIQEGRQEGRQEGIQEGRQEGELQLVLRLLNRRFGALDESLQQQIRGLSIEQLETLAEQLLDFATLQDLETWLNQN
jgi:predicted transposase YdaD